MRHHVVFAMAAADPPPYALRALPDGAPEPEAPDGVAVARSPHLAQWVVAGEGRVEGHYVFDEVYAAAHPEALDPQHLALLHALLTVKLFDDGDLLLAPRQLAGALRWPRVDEPRRSLADR